MKRFILLFLLLNVSVTAHADDVRMSTSKGDIYLKVHSELAPETAANFLRLVNSGWYDGKQFYRVVPGFVIQAGANRDDIVQPNVPGEYLEQKSPLHRRGAVGLARDTDPNSGNSEFYIALDDIHRLDGRYTVFAYVVEGFDVIDSIAQVELKETYIVYEGQDVAFHQPIEPVVIHSAKVITHDE
ncbi:MAG: peptidylprolyl isomerase [Gammaproteobacteria bacterium]|nr:peptidylprolyl isomerase [Gammaproteobacteria bacterium]